MSDHTNINIKKDIFRQIDSELLSKSHQAVRPQKTKNNYFFVIILDICALFFAIVGGFAVYNIFREQEINLVIGEKAIQSLEQILLQQIDKQRELVLIEKENELRSTQTALARVEGELEKTRQSMQQEIEQKLALEKSNLKDAIEKELVGKSLEEQTQIRLRYKERLRLLEERSNLEKQEREKELQEQFDRKEKEINASFKELQKQLKVAQSQAEISHKKLQNVQKKQEKRVEEKPVIVQGISEFANIKIEIASIFNSIQTDLNSGKTNQIKRKLNTVKQIMQRSDAKFVPQEVLAADLFLIAVLEEFIQNSEKISIVNAQLVEQSNSLETLRHRYQTLQQELEKGVSIPIQTGKYRVHEDTQIIYMNTPDGYIIDIIDGIGIVSLNTGIYLKKGKKVDIFQVNTGNNITLSKLGTAVSIVSQGMYSQVDITAIKNVRIGDLIYLQKNNVK